jgi:co-chaperonin GroES (HSP10)
MKFTPVNNYLYVETLEEEESEESGILLPEEYRPTENPFMAVRVLDAGESGWTPGVTLIVEGRMLHSIRHGADHFAVIKENYVIGVLS